MDDTPMTAERWLRGSTWRSLSIMWYAGSYTATLYDYPDLNEASRRWVCEGHGDTIANAIAHLDSRIPRFAAANDKRGKLRAYDGDVR